MGNLRRSYLLARRGKRTRPDVVAFSNDLEENLLRIRQSILDGTLGFGPYCAFKIYEPKERTIRVAPFVDRVAHHALMRICEPVFDAYQIDDSYACRKGKGTYAALERAKVHSLKQTWFLKLDMRKYFDSISHDRLKEFLRYRFKEMAILELFDRIIDSHCSDTFPDAELRGLPIGNLTSQFFANHFLAVADRYAKEQLGCRAYLRYMDDIVLWDHDRHRLIQNGMELSTFCKGMGLFVKPWCLNRSSKGIPLLGYVVYKGFLYLSTRAERRYRAKLKTAWLLLEEGVFEEESFAAHIVPLVAFRNHARGRWVPEK